MSNHYPHGYRKALAQLIREGNAQDFIDLRYPYVQETEPFIFEHEDFRGTDITKFPVAYNICCKRCDFGGAVIGTGDGLLGSQSGVDKHGEAAGLGLLFVAFMTCNMQKADLRHARAAACQFYDCDFGGALWGEQSRFGWPDRILSCSFDKVILDAGVHEFLEGRA